MKYKAVTTKPPKFVPFYILIETKDECQRLQGMAMDVRESVNLSLPDDELLASLEEILRKALV